MPGYPSYRDLDSTRPKQMQIHCVRTLKFKVVKKDHVELPSLLSSGVAHCHDALLLKKCQENERTFLLSRHSMYMVRTDVPETFPFIATEGAVSGKCGYSCKQRFLSEHTTGLHSCPAFPSSRLVSYSCN